MTLEELRTLRASKKADLKWRTTAGKNIQIIVGMGTCGIAAGAKDTMNAFLHLIDESELTDSVLLRQTGCMGFCNAEPTVEVIVPGMPAVIYGRVDSVVAGSIVREHLVGHCLLDTYILDKPAVDTVTGGK
ncbi:MAG: (2Fe-2S) ferredoxin domain-containing protein [Spirochaetaceae bacterium]|jgi:NADP-reducing hydrogenase subunit HndB|nr:(2Fe-2S) ferredoxin domain-containing protein [Spirochaetaceae bacterium]